VPRGEADVGIGYSQQIITRVDAGAPIVTLAGMHTGCGEVWTRPGISSIGDLKGKTIAVRVADPVSDAWYGFWAAILASVGIDPRRDVNFVAYGEASSPLEIFLQGQSDAILVLANEVPTLRASPKNAGNKLLINMLQDPPWRQYYCCQLIVNRDWAHQNPAATRRVTRALLRANDRVAKDPAAAVTAGVAQGMVAPAGYDFERAVLKNSSFEWRDIDAAATLLYFAVQLAQVKLVNGRPQQLVTQASAFEILAELKRQLPRAN
jgi:NitT/TauT family transport system substrate-binding protein